MSTEDTLPKLNRDAKAMIHLAFEDLGGLPRLVEWANQPANIGTFYTQIWSKIIPKDIKAEVDQSITIEVLKFGDDSYALKNDKERAVITGHQSLDYQLNSTNEALEDAIIHSIDDED